MEVGDDEIAVVVLGIGRDVGKDQPGQASDPEPRFFKSKKSQSNY